MNLLELSEAHEAWARSYYRRRGQQTGEAANLRATFNAWIKHCGPTANPSQTNQHQVRAWIDQLAAAGLTRCYINAHLSRLRRIMRWAADLDYIDISVCERLRLVRPLKPDRSPARESVKPAATPSIVQQYLQHLRGEARDLIIITASTGCRVSELIDITNAEVHRSARGMHLQPIDHKTSHHGHARIIPLPPIAACILDKYARPLCPIDRVFSLTYSGLHSALQRAKKKHNLPAFSTIMLRRMMAQQLREKASIDVAAAMLGHSRISTTEIYAPLQLQKAFDALEVLKP